jgi:hypothetical protein
MYSFCTSSSLQIPFFVRVASIEGSTLPPPLSELFLNPSQRNIASNTKYFSQFHGSFTDMIVQPPMSMHQHKFGRIANHLRFLSEQATNHLNPLDESIYLAE